MKLIRYAIRKDDLHQLLRSIGVLRENESLLSVNNIDLAEQQQDVVVVTVNAEPTHVLPPDPGDWTDKEIQQRYAELSVLEDAAKRQLEKARGEMEALRSERDKRSSNVELSDDGIPGTFEMKIWHQVRPLLGGGEKIDG